MKSLVLGMPFIELSNKNNDNDKNKTKNKHVLKLL